MSGYFNSPGSLLSIAGNRARQRRLALGLRQEDLAAASGVTVATLRRFESGRNVGFQAVAQIALALRAEQGFMQLFPAPETQSIDEIVKRRRLRKRARRRS